jgi:iron complex transport system substrate-binding protein
VVDSQGTEHEFDTVPETVISLAPNITEIVFALGSEDKLIGRTDWCNYPEEASQIESLGNIDQPDVERILELNPDMVLMSEMTKKELAFQIRDSGIPFFIVDNEESFDGAYASVEMVGAVLGKSEEAERIVSDMKQHVSRVKETVSGAETPTVYYVMGYGEYGDYTAGKGTFISEMIKEANAVNVADDTEGWTYSVERLVEHNPDVILLSMWAPAEGLSEATGYKDLSAVKEGNVHVIDDDKLQRLGPRLAEAFEDMAKAIHPDLFE